MYEVGTGKFIAYYAAYFCPQSYCLKVKEMDDEEYSYAALQEPLYRVETGNYEYRYETNKKRLYLILYVRVLLNSRFLI